MDKGGLFLVVAVLAVIVMGSVLLSSADPTSAAILQAQAGIAAAPVMISPLGSLWTFAARAMIVMAGLIILGGLAWFAYDQITARRSSGGWTSGPNARWGRMGRMQKSPSLMDLLTLQIYKNMLGDNPPRAGVLPDERRKVDF